jgi:hypothetical protein
MIKSESVANLVKALSVLQGQIHNPTKDTKAHQYKYADLAQVLEIVRPLLSQHKLSFVQLPECHEDIRVSVETVLFHESGEFISSTLCIPIPAGQNKVHAIGSAISYCKRYALMSMLGLFGEDDDGTGGAAFQRNNPPAAIQCIPEDVLASIEVIKVSFSEDDKITGIEYFDSLEDVKKRTIYNNLTPDIKAWLKSLIENKPRGK